MAGWPALAAPTIENSIHPQKKKAKLSFSRFVFRPSTPTTTDHVDNTDDTGIMGALKYVEELARKKQSDVIHFLLRVRCWEVS